MQQLHGDIISFSQGFASEIPARLVAKRSCTLLLPSFWGFSAALLGKLNDGQVSFCGEPFALWRLKLLDVEVSGGQASARYDHTPWHQREWLK